MSTGKKAKSATRSTGQKAKTAGKTASRKSSNTKTSQTTTKTATTQAVQPTHDQIALRAQHIWRQKGCLWGEEEQNWFEAETQLIAELNGQKT